ncbi:MAG: polysaccharide lyase 6 family protein, partial [Ferruginibacter sp.]
LNAANKAAKPGDTVLLKNGNWQDIDIELTCNGTARQPIVFKAETNGQVIIKGKSSLRLGGSYIIVEGLLFTEGFAPDGSVWEFRKGKQRGNNCRITNCMIKSFNNTNRKDENYWVALYGKNNRIDHCKFIDKTNLGVLMAVILDDDRSRLNAHSIDSNYFGIRKPLGSNGGEIIRVGVSQHCTFYSNTVIQNNLFEHCDGETEIVSIKSCGNTVRNNVFKECQGAVVLRHGNDNTIEGNIFWGNGKDGTGGVRVINEGNWVVGNYFFNCVGTGFRSPLSVMNGVFNSPPHRYLPVRDAVIANNTFYNCTPISLGEGADTERSVKPINVYVFNNLFFNSGNTVLFNNYSPIDSIYFANNFISNKQEVSTIKGFEKADIRLMKWDNAGFPSLAKNSVNILPGSMSSLAGSRLKAGFPERVGCGNLTHFKTAYNQSKQMGINWKELKTDQSDNSKTVKCKDAASLYAALAADTKTENIQLTGSSYLFTKPLVINKSVSIIGPDKEISFASEYNILNLFEIKGNSSLTLKNLNVKLDLLAINQFISTDTSGSCSHFSISLNNCQFSGSDLLAFYYGAKNSYADEISVTNCVFKEMLGPLFNLKDELDDKGFYNTEKMVISNCLFENYKGSIVNMYRGGNDESTMGPKLFFTDNKIENSKNDFELLRLYGVQESLVTNNIFVNSNQLAPVIVYEDKVRADHRQKNNTLTNSGPIVENKFVTNLKD